MGKLNFKFPYLFGYFAEYELAKKNPTTNLIFKNCCWNILFFSFLIKKGYI